MRRSCCQLQFLANRSSTCVVSHRRLPIVRHLFPPSIFSIKPSPFNLCCFLSCPVLLMSRRQFVGNGTFQLILHERNLGEWHLGWSIYVGNLVPSRTFNCLEIIIPG